MRKRMVPLLLLCALLSAALGLSQRQEQQVLQKAATVCLECIGVG